MEKTIEVRYAGVVVSRSTVIRELDTRGLFLSLAEPLPVGTPVILRIGERDDSPEVQGKVEVVSESPELAHSGMRVRFADSGSAALFGTPSERSTSEVSATVAAPSSASGHSEATPTLSAPSASAPISIGPSSSARTPLATTPPAAASQSSGQSVPQAAGEEGGEDDHSSAVSTASADGQRIPAPDPSAFSGQGGGRKNRRTRRR